MKRKLFATAVVFFGTILSACGGYGYSSGYYSYGAPPPPRYGVIGVAPGPGYIWVDGFWNRGSRGWNWSNGYWARPPHGRSYYVRPEWRREGNRWRLHQGRWR